MRDPWRGPVRSSPSRPLTAYPPHTAIDPYEIGPHTLAIGKEPFLKPSGDGPHVALEVDDFEQTIEHLRGHTVTFALEPVELPGCMAAIIVDPDGNKLGIHKRKPR